MFGLSRIDQLEGLQSLYVFVNPDTGKPYTVGYYSSCVRGIGRRDRFAGPSVERHPQNWRDVPRNEGGRVPWSPRRSAIRHKHYVVLDESALVDAGRVLAERSGRKSA